MTITPEEYSARLTQLYGLVNGDLAEHTVLPAAADLLIEIKQRVVNEGRATSGAAIGSYSTKPLYASKQQFVAGGFNPQGKKSKMGITPGDILVPTVRYKESKNLKMGTKFLAIVKQRKVKNYTIVKSNYADRKTMYLPEGYKELRNIQSLRTDIVNFRYSGDLLNSYQLQKMSQSVILGLTSEKSAKKREGLEKKFGDVFHATEQEKQNYISKVNFLLLRVTRGIIAGEGLQATATIEYL